MLYNHSTEEKEQFKEIRKVPNYHGIHDRVNFQPQLFSFQYFRRVKLTQILIMS